MMAKRIILVICLFLFGVSVPVFANEIDISVQGSVFDQNNEYFMDFGQILSRIKKMDEEIPVQAEYETEAQYEARIQPFKDKLAEIYDSEYNVSLKPKSFPYGEGKEFYRFVLRFPFAIYRKDDFSKTESLEYVYEVPYNDVNTIAGKMANMKFMLYFKIKEDKTVSIRRAVLIVDNKKVHEWD